MSEKWQQYFPTYSFENPEIAIEEYKTAAKSLESEERIFLTASNISLLGAAVLGSLAVGSLSEIIKRFSGIIPGKVVIVLLIALLGIFSIISLKYFADRQKSIVYAARKVIVLRKMLGLTYGNIRFVLPNWRIEGAENPFSIRMFPGWATYVTYPFYILAGISFVVAFFLITEFLSIFQTILKNFTIIPLWVIVLSLSFSWTFILAFVYRKSLLEFHETMSLLFVKDISKTIYLTLIPNFEYVIYRAMLSKYEFIRLGVKLDNLLNMLVFIEDRQFYNHIGISFKAIFRAFLGLIRLKRKSGGSTITQQICRTLFIKQQKKIFRRKFVEILLALWLNKVLDKKLQLEIYVASVRFEHGIFGAIQAMKYFFGEIKRELSVAESFFLIERVSNIQSELLSSKILQTIQIGINQGILNQQDVVEILKLYQNSIDSGKIKDPNLKIVSLRTALTN